MMLATNLKWHCWIFLLSLVMLAGCGGQDAQLAALRQQLVLETEPSDATTIEAARSDLEGAPQVTFAGRVDLTSQALENKSQTSFMVNEILDAGHDHGTGQDASDCPFCKHKAAKVPKAAVQFVDGAGNVLPHDPAELFGIQSGDEVVIRGTGELIEELNLLNVIADGIFVRRH